MGGWRAGLWIEMGKGERRQEGGGARGLERLEGR